MRAAVILLSLLLASCGSCGGGSTTPVPPTTNPQPPAAQALLDQTQTLDATGTEPFVRRFELDVGQGETLAVSVTSAQFDPFLQVTPPGAATLSNDDYLGNRQQSSLTLITSQPGRMHIAISSARRGSSGTFRVLVQRLGAAASQIAALRAGSTHEGTIGPGDPTLPDGRPYDSLAVQVDASPLAVRIEGGGTAPLTAIVSDPHGTVLAPDATGGYQLVSPGSHRVQILGAPGAAQGTYRVAVTAGQGGAATVATLARSHHQLPPASTDAPVAIGDLVKGMLAESDGRLPSGEAFDSFALTLAAGAEEIVVELISSELDPYLLVVGPDGAHLDNDGAGEIASVRITPTTPGIYRVIATSFDARGRGSYSLKVSPVERTIAAVAPTSAPPTANQSIRGALATGDATLRTGELYDEHRFTFQAGQHVRLEARSTAFDTYLIARPPVGDQLDNDDQTQGNRNAALDFTALAGEYRVMVTSYQPGMQGDYELVLGGGGASTGGTTPPAVVDASGETTRGALATSDSRLQSGEYSDSYTMQFGAGEAVELLLSSTAFDPYLIVRSPSGNQMDNDDLTPSSRDAGLTIPVAEAGEYSVMVTSYQPGETGAYVLTRRRGAAVPRPNQGSGGRGVAGVFVGISDYPGAGDLPECANDAIKLAEALRERGLLSADRQIVLTDAQATQSNIRNALTTIGGQLGPDDVFLFFYSGHGGQRPGSSDPREIDGADEYIAVYDGELLDDDVGRIFDGIHARLAMIALDSCYSGGFAKDVVTAPHRVGMFSSEEDVLSAVASQFQAGGYLSHFLRTGVAGEADAQPADGVLTVGELTHFVYAQFGAHHADVQLASAYQHLVVDRGAVHVDEVLWSYR